MRVLCYVNGDAGENETYNDVAPADAARMFVEDRDADEEDGPVDIVVEPADEAAGDIEGWTLLPDGARVRLFRVAVRWVSEEVESFDDVAS